MAPSQQPEQLLNNLSDMGVELESEMMNYLLDFISFNHPGEQERIYHNLNHTLEVTTVFFDIVSPLVLFNKWKVLGLLAGLLHDLDPERIPNTPPSVDRTIKFIDNNQEVKDIIDYFCKKFRFTFGQLKTLILATDYDSNPEKLEVKWNRFVSECEIHFRDEFFSTQDNQLTNLGVVLGEILAYSDKLATYIQPINIVLTRVDGLDFELRTLNNSETPTKGELIRETGKFMSNELFESTVFMSIPVIYRDKLLSNLRFFNYFK